MAKSWRSNSEILYPIASKHAKYPWFQYFYENQSQTSPVPSVSFQNPECISVVSSLSHQKNKEKQWLSPGKQVI